MLPRRHQLRAWPQDSVPVTRIQDLSAPSSLPVTAALKRFLLLVETAEILILNDTDFVGYKESGRDPSKCFSERGRYRESQGDTQG